MSTRAGKGNSQNAKKKILSAGEERNASFMKTAGEYKFIENGCHKTYCCCLNVKTGVNVNGA